MASALASIYDRTIGRVAEWVDPARSIRLVRRTRIADAADSARVKVVGTVRAVDPPIHAPLTERACVFYTGSIALSRFGRAPIAAETKGVRFIVEDATGRAFVDPAGAVFIVRHDLATTRYFSRLSAAQKNDLYQLKHAYPGQRYRLRESVLCEGDRIAVLGYGTWQPDPDGGDRVGNSYRAGPPTRLHLARSPEAPLLLGARRKARRR